MLQVKKHISSGGWFHQELHNPPNYNSLKK
jgi:hypothetical protein